jgi:cellulose synthase/poly-beta-1,6-N-acetylglucosamine synthase-like glycosyltransferase
MLLTASVVGLLICLFLTIYPYIIYPIILKALPSKPLQVSNDFAPKIALLFCAYNEERSIPEKLDNIRKLAARYPNVEAFCFDDGSSDKTYELLTAEENLVTVIRGGGRNGKAHGMKLLAAAAKADILVFTDANVILDLDALPRIASYFGDPDVGGLCGTLKYIGAEGSATSSVGSLYWRLEEYLKDEESRTGNVMGADGSIFALRRSLYPEFPDSVLDDLTVSMAAVFADKRLIKVPDVIAYERLVADRKEEFARKVRIASRAFHTHLFLRDRLARMSFLDQFKYLSRKFVRWFGAVFVALSLVFAVAALSIVSGPAALAFLALVAAVLLIALRARSGLLASFAEILIALVATLLGVIKALRGRTVVVWTPASTR